MSMKKAALALLLTFLFAGCTSVKQDTAQQNTPKQTDQQQTQPSTQDPAASTPAPDATHDEVRQAFGLTGEYIELPATAIPSLGLGQVEKLPLDQKQGLALAKAVSSGLTNTGWEQQDATPGIFVSTDGSKFAIGMKKKDGSFTLERFELQTDGTYKSVGKETKPAK
jgi:hypothetical protein